MTQSALAAAAVAPAWYPRPQPDSLTERAVRAVAMHPKYGGGGCTVDVRYLWCGAPGAPTVIVQGGISASRDVLALGGDDAPGWWQSLVGRGRALDLHHYRVLAIDWVTPDELDAAAVSSEDQADILAGLLTQLGIASVHAFVGASYGAMVGLAFATRHPRALERLVLLAGAHRAHPLACGTALGAA